MNCSGKQQSQKQNDVACHWCNLLCSCMLASFLSCALFAFWLLFLFSHSYNILFTVTFLTLLLWNPLISQAVVGLFCSWSNLFIIYPKSVDTFYLTVVTASVTTNNVHKVHRTLYLLIHNKFQLSNFIKRVVSGHKCVFLFTKYSSK